MPLCRGLRCYPSWIRRARWWRCRLLRGRSRRTKAAHEEGAHGHSPLRSLARFFATHGRPLACPNNGVESTKACSKSRGSNARAKAAPSSYASRPPAWRATAVCVSAGAAPQQTHATAPPAQHGASGSAAEQGAHDARCGGSPECTYPAAPTLRSRWGPSPGSPAGCLRRCSMRHVSSCGAEAAPRGAHRRARAGTAPCLTRTTSSPSPWPRQAPS